MRLVWRVTLDTLDRGRIVLADEVGTHTSLAPSYGYSPRGQRAFSKVKRLLKRIGPRTREVLVEAIGKTLDAVSVKDAKGFFTHCGYGAVEQQL